MRQRSLTNSRKHENLSLRRKYAKANQWDELGLFTDLAIAGLPAGRLEAHETHHILGGLGGNRRHDVVSNLIRLHREVHGWVGKYRADGLALCCQAKLRKGEFDPVLLTELHGPGFHFPGYFSTLEGKLQFEVGRGAWYEVMAFLKAKELISEGS